MAHREKFTPGRVALLAVCLVVMFGASVMLFLLVRHIGWMERPALTIATIVGTLLMILGLNRLAFRRAKTPAARKEAKQQAFLTCFAGGWILLICIAGGLSQ